MQETFTRLLLESYWVPIYIWLSEKPVTPPNEQAETRYADRKQFQMTRPTTTPIRNSGSTYYRPSSSVTHGPSRSLYSLRQFH